MSAAGAWWRSAATGRICRCRRRSACCSSRWASRRRRRVSACGCRRRIWVCRDGALDRGADGVGWLRRLGRKHICRSVVGLADGAVSGEDEVFGDAGVAGAGRVGGGAVEEVAGFVIGRLLMGIEGLLGLYVVEVVCDFLRQVNFLWRVVGSGINMSVEFGWPVDRWQ